MKRCGFLALLIALAAVSIPAQAARTFTIAQTAPAAPGEVDMGTTQTLTYTITNTASGGNAGERIYRMRFRLSGTCTGGGCTATLFTTASAAPANWTRSSFSTTSVTYTAATWADSIPSGSSLSFSVVVTAGKSTQDRTETLRDARASFTTDTIFSDGIKNAGTSTINTPGSWILQSLQITGFQTTDTSGVATSAIAAGVNFRIVITVKNISVATINGIVANPSPPTATTGAWSGALPSCSLTSTSPSPLNLAAGASGTMTYTCTTLSSNSGTVTYSVTDVRSGASVTSRSGTSNVLSVSPLSVGITITGPYPADTTCHFSGDTATFVMKVTNNTAGPLTSITPSALTRAGSNTTIGAFTGPATSCSGAFPLPVGGFCNYTWTAPVTIVGSYPSSGPKPTFLVTGSATANPGPITSPTNTSNTQDVDGFVVTVAPTTTNTDSTNQQFTFSLLNSGCANVNQVAITAPGAFSFSGDGYSLINSTAEDWTQTGTTFAAGTVLPTGASGDFSLVFTSTPSATGTYTFSLNVTDQNAVSKTVTVDVPVAAFGSGTINVASPATWHEVFQ
jgi:large repetitive protein